ncbi:MAG: hypothetical protein WDO14_23110 [Bacteroidota bacterium]
MAALNHSISRTFKYIKGDKFELQILNFADPFGKAPLAKLVIKGSIQWAGEHPIAKDAYKVNFIADEAYDVTPLLQGFADVLNQIASKGYEPWKVNETQSIFKKAFAPFGLAEGQVFSEFDLICIFNNMMFWGARNVDGRGFDTEANRPTNLQIPLYRE